MLLPKFAQKMFMVSLLVLLICLVLLCVYININRSINSCIAGADAYTIKLIEHIFGQWDVEAVYAEATSAFKVKHNRMAMDIDFAELNDAIGGIEKYDIKSKDIVYNYYWGKAISCARVKYEISIDCDSGGAYVYLTIMCDSKSHYYIDEMAIRPHLTSG